MVKLYEYESYEEYKEAQVKRNQKRINQHRRSWVGETEVETTAAILLEKYGNIEFGLCHGTKQGNEQKWFAQYLNAEVLGTEISPAATQFPNTIEWDFHDVKPEWEGNVDFIYSNTLDHSYDPRMCLTQWMKCLKPGGYCLLHHSKEHLVSCASDPFGATLEEYRTMILDLGFVVEDETKLERKKRPLRAGRILWVQN